MKKRFNVIAAAVLALGMVVGMCGCEGLHERYLALTGRPST